MKRLTVGQMLSKIERLKKAKKITDESLIVSGDVGATIVGNVTSMYEMGGELVFDFIEPDPFEEEEE